MISFPIQSPSIGGDPKMGVLYAALVNSLASPSYQIGDEADNRFEGRYNFEIPINPAVIARPKQGLNSFSLLENLNVFGNDSRFTRVNGTPLTAFESYVAGDSFIDHLYGKEYRYVMSGGNLTYHVENAWSSFGADWRIANTMEMLSIMVEIAGVNPFVYVSRIVQQNRARIITCTVLGNNSNSLHCAGSSATSIKSLFSTGRLSINDALYVRDIQHLNFTPS